MTAGARLYYAAAHATIAAHSSDGSTAMIFCPWYTADAALDQAPSGPGIVQVRVAEGLCQYPGGRTAMVHYTWTQDIRTTVLTLVQDARAARCWFRHSTEWTEAEWPMAQQTYEQLLVRFVRRFGCAPRFPQGYVSS